MPISWGFIYSHVIYACFIFIYTYDVYFTCDMYFVFYYALARESTTFVVLRHSCTFLHCIYLHYWSYTSLRLMLFVVKTTWNKAYSILFYSSLLRICLTSQALNTPEPLFRKTITTHHWFDNLVLRTTGIECINVQLRFVSSLTRICFEDHMRFIMAGRLFYAKSFRNQRCTIHENKTSLKIMHRSSVKKWSVWSINNNFTRLTGDTNLAAISLTWINFNSNRGK